MSGEADHYDAIIVGAGVAGLTAAQQLSQSGLAVTCVEARDRVGGRAYTLVDSGLAIDMGATWFWHNEPLIASLLEQLSLESFPQDDSGDALFDAPGRPLHRLTGNPLDGHSARFTSGAQSLPDALASLLPEGALRLSFPVTAIEHDDDRVLVTSGVETVPARHTIVALPPALAVTSIAFTPELPHDIRQAAVATPVWMADTVKAVAVYDAPFWRRDRLAGAVMSHQGPFREFHDHSGPDADGAGAIFGFAPAAVFGSVTDTEIAERFVEQLGCFFGEQATGPRTVHVTNWAREEYTKPPFAASRPASGGFGHPLLQDAVSERIHWASTEIATAFGGHVEGAVRAGLQAAQQMRRRIDGT